MSNKYYIAFFLLIFSFSLWGHEVSGTITENGRPLSGVLVFVEGTSFSDLTDQEGIFNIKDLSGNEIRLITYYQNYQTQVMDLQLPLSQSLKIELAPLETLLEEIEISGQSEVVAATGWLNAVSGVGIYEAKKTELIRPEMMTMNKAANVSRQIYARVPGLNIWETDGAGVQLGIGGRGLNPNRTSNFNVRQNGYDISADALGYPESYYTPPVQAIRRIELIRGAASLQYGTQFGGMLNFEFKEAPENKSIAFESIQTAGSFGLFNSFNSLAGTKGKWSYYGYYNYKHSGGYRENAGINLHNGYFSLTYRPTALSSIQWESTHMSYLAQQPGGLTDLEFRQDPRQSKRSRNWFDVDWNMTALIIDHRFTPKLKINNRIFLLDAHRYAVGNLGRIDRPDNLNENRDLLKDDFHNLGNELRLLYHHKLLGKTSVMVIGNRLYSGLTWRRQGEGTAAADADFMFINESQAMDSNFDLPSRNVSFFVEEMVQLTSNLSITPGLRYEYILTEAEGYYYNRLYDLAGNILLEDQIYEQKSKPRSLILGGMGVSFKPTEQVELYGNISQNFRAINFNDIRVVNPSFQVDPDISDERGYNADLGIRGKLADQFKFDASIFYLSYQDRIGSVLKREPDPMFNYLVDRTYRYRTNIADAGIVGIESYLETSLLKQIIREEINLSAFINFAYIHGKYLESQENGISGNNVEMVPPINIKTGLNAKVYGVGFSMLFGYVQEHFSDATNTDSSPPVPTAVEGLIPSYHFMDLSMDYRWRKWLIEAGSNNVTNQSFFTRRAAGYPGPGILPSDGRSFYLSVGISL